MEILTNFLYQVLFTVGIIVLFGLLIALCRHWFCRLVGRGGPTILLITGAVGTPVHELSHALMCLLFGHKIREIKLYRPGADDGALGYVTHTYNPKNIYHQIGNFFIGIAPILGGSGVLLLMMFLMVPNVFSSVWSELSMVGMIFGDGVDFNKVGEFLAVVLSVFVKIFDFSNTGNTWWWIFIILALMISSHMELSGADIKGGIKGLLILLGILLLVDAAIYFIYPPALVAVTSAMTAGGLALMSFLMISGVFSFLMLAVALVIKFISLLFNR